jgi:lysophospholipase L1-like esterase
MGDESGRLTPGLFLLGMASIRISFIGDSLVAGTGDEEFVGWPGRLAKAALQRGHDVTTYNLGVRANTSADILARWRREAEARIASGQDNHLVFQFGVNDTKEDGGKRIVSPEQAIAQAQAILSDAKAWLPTLMVGPPPVIDETRNARIADMSARLEALCGEIGVPYFSTFEKLGLSRIWKNAVTDGDGVHPVGAGYSEWAKFIDAWPDWRAWVP